MNISLYKAGALVTNWGNFINAGDTLPTFNPASATTTTYVVKVNPAAACIGDALIFERRPRAAFMYAPALPVWPPCMDRMQTG